MACLDCDDCGKADPLIPKCFTGRLRVLSSSDIKTILFEKAGGGTLSVDFPGDDGVADIDFSALDSDFFLESSGLIKMTGYDSQGLALTFHSNVSGMLADAECVLLQFKHGLPDAAEIELTFTL